MWKGQLSLFFNRNITKHKGTSIHNFSRLRAKYKILTKCLMLAMISLQWHTLSFGNEISGTHGPCHSFLEVGSRWKRSYHIVHSLEFWSVDVEIFKKFLHPFFFPIGKLATNMSMHCIIKDANTDVILDIKVAVAFFFLFLKNIFPFLKVTVA